MILTYKYRLKGKRASRQLRRLAFQSNQVWNYCVQTQRSVQRARKFGLSPKWPSQYDLQALTAGTSRDLNFHAQSINGVCEQFVRSRDLHRLPPIPAIGWGSPLPRLGALPEAVPAGHSTFSEVPREHLQLFRGQAAAPP